MEEKQKPRRWVLWIVVWLVALVVYPLSSGPMMYLATHGYPMPTVLLDIIYWPVSSFGKLVPPVASFFRWYWVWWIRL